MNQLLQELGQALGIGELPFDEAGYCALQVDDFVVHIERDQATQSILLHAQVAPLGPASAALYEQLLEANFCHRFTAGGTLGIDRERGVISLAMRLHLQGLPLSDLTRRMEAFLEACEHWIRQLRAPEAPAAEVAISRPLGDLIRG